MGPTRRAPCAVEGYARVGLVAAVIALAGCSLLFDASAHMGGRDGAVDAALDAMNEDGGVDSGDAGTDAPPDGGPTIPTVASARFDRYFVFSDETVEAIPVGVTPATAELRFVWRVDGVPLAESSATLDLASAGVEAGSELSVELTPRHEASGVEGDSVIVGPITVLTQETRWRPLLPSRSASHPVVGLDTPGRRLVLVEGLGANRGLAWELPLDAREPRWVALDTGATAPPLLEEPSVASDERGRLFVFEGTASPPTLHVLDLRARGHERWASITLPESARRVGASMAYDAARDRLLLFGGEVEGEILDGLATVTLADPPQWAEVDVGGIRPAPRRDASIAIDTTTQRLYLLGGRDATPLLDAWALELATDRFASLPIALSSAVIGQAMVARGDALLVWHLDGTTGPTRVRLSDFEVSELAGDGPPSSPRPSAFVWGDDALVVTSRGEAISSGVSAWRIAEGGAGELLHGVGVHAPPALERAASGTLSERWYVLLGSSPSNARHLDAWVFDRDRWSPIAWTGTPPAAGADASQAVPSGDRLALFAGGTAYELTAASSTTLSSRRLNDGSIPAFSGATAFEGCDGSTPIGVTGGGAMSDWYTSSQVLVCGTTCAFREGSAPAPEPGRGFSASTRMNVGGADRVVLWGGYANISPLPSSLHTTARPCGASGPTWSSVSVSGATPGGRGGHTLTRVDASRALMFGGSFFAASPREGGRSSELWSLDTSAASARWTRLEPPGTRPSGRIFHVAGWDEARQRLLVFGGRSGLPTHETFGDLWELRVLP